MLSKSAWRKDNSFGSSYADIFDGMNDVEIYSLYFNGELPQNKEVKRFFQISEQALVRNLFKPSIKTGKQVVAENENADDNMYGAAVNTARKLRWQIFFWARDLLWTMGRWWTQELHDYIDSVEADVLFFPLYAQSYMLDAAVKIQAYTNKPLVFYISDDCYTLKQFSLSPLFWINRFILRAKIRRAMKACDLLYVISDLQKKEYERIFDIPCKVLTKGARFEGEAPIKSDTQLPLKLTYTGNVGSGRWQVLGAIAKALKALNKEETKATMDIYTRTNITSKMRKVLNIPGACTIKGAVTADEVEKIQTDADILVHVESFKLKEVLKARQSFSTKIVDYLSRGRCVLAIGDARLASINHLRNNDAAVVVTSKKEIKQQLGNLLDHPKLIKKYSQQAWECGQAHHDINDVHHMVSVDIAALSNNEPIKE